MASAGYDSASDDESDGGSASCVCSARASSVTTEDWDMRSASPGPSVFSMTSSMRINAFRQEYGRGLNNYSEIYRLPADEEELERLDQQHAMFREIMGKYPPPIFEVLADTPGQVKTVVDLGCGSGSWIVDVARDFPNCSCVAVDLIPMQIIDIPPNCRSEVDDINLGLQHFYGEFNVAHARLISTGIRDYKGLVDQISHVLKPGGLIDLTEFDFRVYDFDKQPIPITVDASPLARWFHLALRAVQMQGGEPDAANHLYGWTRDHGAFEDVQYREWWLQTSCWNPGQDDEARQKNRWGAAMREDILAFLKSGRPLLLGTGVPEQILNPLEEEAERELMEARVPTYVRIQNVYGRRR
ncbi:methyltransferase domain-containing protein [Phanerochaete sordida]|uniref:Methyltransferase domain-containing protein n=1 Tax=Phanerochaete sordida TaxID=48140 RepID=A0A9P3G460_9APHY|nr:methyltransferase domain-containing protein [Phanerochaete sordida]